MLRNADRTIHVSDYIRRQAIALGAPESRAVTVRKGVDCDRFDAPLTKEKRPRLSILTVGGLIKRKGIDTILEALALLTDTHEFSFVVIGKGPELTRLKELSDRLRLSERTQFVGYVSRKEIPARFAACDIFVLASTWEASGNVLLEAMATGRPVVCTASGGPPEYVDDGVTGYVVPVGEPRPMAEKIRRLLDDANLRHEFGKRGWERARREFTYARMINETLRVYQEAIATRRARDS
jgi:glycosyltransferase involved in cell wall biosynthesis